MSFLRDPALRHIAATTNDVLPEQVWRYDTGADDALGDLARILHKTAHSYNRALTSLDKAVQLTRRPDIHAVDLGEVLPGATSAMEQQAVLGDVLTDAYLAWRRHHSISDDGVERHLLLYPRDLAHGVVTLWPTSAHMWLVAPDAEAAHAFGVPYADRIVGQVTETLDGAFEPIACTNPHHIAEQPKLGYRLPARDDLATTCRSLLRWWALRHSAAWRSRTPDQLTPTELDHLAH